MRPSLVLIRSMPSLMLASLLWAGHGAQAMVINYTAVDLPDITPGEDLWRYEYQVSGGSFAGGEGFTIFFAPSLYGMVESTPPPVNAGWDILTLQPSTTLPAAGMYDAMAVFNGPSLADPFKVGFTWLGAGKPAAQSFERYDAGFTTIDRGTTIPVPEPGRLSLTLVALGVLGLGARLRRFVGRRQSL